MAYNFLQLWNEKDEKSFKTKITPKEIYKECIPSVQLDKHSI